MADDLETAGQTRADEVRAFIARTPLAQAGVRSPARVFARGARVSASTAPRGIGGRVSAIRSDDAASDPSASNATPVEARADAVPSAPARQAAVAGVRRGGGAAQAVRF